MNCDLEPNFVVGKGTILVVSNHSFEDKYMDVNPFGTLMYNYYSLETTALCLDMRVLWIEQRLL